MPLHVNLGIFLYKAVIKTPNTSLNIECNIIIIIIIRIIIINVP